MNAKQIHTAVAMIFAAYVSTTKADGAEYKAMASTLKASPLNDAEWVKEFRNDMLKTFGEDHKDAAQIRLNIVNNARRVAYGGSKDGKAIRGKGHAAMVEVIESVASLRELRKALADAVPAGLKSEGHGGKRTGKNAKKADAKNSVSVPKVATREEAFAAARKILEFVRDKFTKPSETDLTTKVNACIEALAK